MSTRLSGRTALVTGSTSGIGEAIARRFAGEGASVVVSGRDAARGDAVVSAIRADGGDAVFVAADLAGHPDGIRAFAAEAVAAAGGRLDILVNNAGIFPAGSTASLDDDAVDAILAVNIRAPHVLTAALVPAMVERGAGVVINVGSWVSTVGVAGGPLYSATKAAVEQLTRGWAAEFGASGVRVNTVSPGVTDTGGNASNLEALQAMTAPFPAGRLGTPDEVAQAALFLASDDAAYMHGSTLVVDGGALGTRT